MTLASGSEGQAAYATDVMHMSATDSTAALRVRLRPLPPPDAPPSTLCSSEHTIIQ
jgi:hypothetical protein